MGWSSGSELMTSIIQSMRDNIEDDVRFKIYKDIIKAFSYHDWDSAEECFEEDPIFDKAYQSLFPDDFQEWKECSLMDNFDSD